MKASPMERKLVNSCIQGNRDAQYRLYGRYNCAMYNTCIRILKKQEDAEDALQDAFSIVFRKMDSFRFESTLGAWIKRIVVNTCLNELKKRKNYFLELDETMCTPEEQPDISHVELKIEEIKKALIKLPDGYRTICSLYMFEGYDHREIADFLGISISTSKSQLHRGKKILKQYLIDNG